MECERTLDESEKIRDNTMSGRTPCEMTCV